MIWDEESRQVIRDIVEGKINKFRGCLKLGVHVKTIERKVRAYRKEGEQCFVHGNKARVPSNKINLDAITEFIRTHEMDECNFAELCRLMKEYGNLTVSSSCLRKRFFSEGILSVKCKRNTRKKLRKILNELKKSEQITKEKLETLSALEQEATTGAWCHPTKPRSKYFGERLEMDASSFVWLKGMGKLTLHACIDDASGFLLALWIEEEETLHGYYRIMEQILTKFGIPLALRTDKRTVFTYSKTGENAPEKDTMTQFAFACSRLGIDLKCNSDPDFKPKIERANQTLQGILPFRFSLERITTIEAANAYLQSVFIPYYNSLFGYNYDYVEGKKRTIGSSFAPCTPEQAHTALAVLCERTVNKGSSIQLNNEYLALLDDSGRRIALPYHTKVTVARLLDGSLFATRDDKCYVLEKIPQRYAISPQVDSEEVLPHPKTARPKIPASHPWSYQSQMRFKQNSALMRSLEPYYKGSGKPKYA